jgi:hypothetical protein
MQSPRAHRVQALSVDFVQISARNQVKKALSEKPSRQSFRQTVLPYR